MNDFNDKRIIQELRDRFMVVYHIRIFRIENRVNYVKSLHFPGVNSNELLSSLQDRPGAPIQKVGFGKMRVLLLYKTFVYVLLVR